MYCINIHLTINLLTCKNTVCIQLIVHDYYTLSEYNVVQHCVLVQILQHFQGFCAYTIAMQCLFKSLLCY